MYKPHYTIATLPHKIWMMEKARASASQLHTGTVKAQPRQLIGNRAQIWEAFSFIEEVIKSICSVWKSMLHLHLQLMITVRNFLLQIRRIAYRWMAAFHIPVSTSWWGGAMSCGSRRAAEVGRRWNLALSILQHTSLAADLAKGHWWLSCPHRNKFFQLPIFKSLG